MTEVSRLISDDSDTLVSVLLLDPLCSITALSDGVVLVECEGKIPWSLAEYVRIFESTWISNSVTPDVRALLVRNLFDWLGWNYEGSIDVARNIDCYECLFDRGISLLETYPKRVLDFGCGSGLILDASFVKEVDVVGCDISSAMMRVAQHKGLVVESCEALATAGPFDMALSAYVLHYDIDPRHTIGVAAGGLAAGGVLVANFHKRHGLETFLKNLVSAPFDLLGVFESDRHGPILAARRT